MLCISRNICFINEFLYHYIAHCNGAMLKSSIYKKENGLRASIKILDLLTESKARRAAIQFFWKNYLDWSFCTHIEKDYRIPARLINNLDLHIKHNKKEIVSVSPKKIDAIIACFLKTKLYLKIVKLKMLLLARMRKND